MPAVAYFFRCSRVLKKTSRALLSCSPDSFLENYQTTPNAVDLITDFEKLVHHQEEPFLSSSIYVQFRVFGLAAGHRVKVLLDGQGADVSCWPLP